MLGVGYFDHVINCRSGYIIGKFTIGSFLVLASLSWERTGCPLSAQNVYACMRPLSIQAYSKFSNVPALDQGSPTPSPALCFYKHGVHPSSDWEIIVPQ